MINATRTLCMALLLFCLAGPGGLALANDHGGEGGASDLVMLEAFTTNLAPEAGGASRFIQLTLALRLSDPHGAEAIKAYMPQVRNDILLVLSSHSGADLQLTKAREALAEELRDAVNGIVGTPAGSDKRGKRIPAEGPVKHALFTSFIIQ